MSYLILNYLEVDADKNIKIGVPKKVSNTILNTGVRHIEKNEKRLLYLQTSSMYVGDIEKLVEGKPYIYLELYVPNNSVGNPFVEAINGIDLQIIKKIWENRLQWGFKEDTSLIEVSSKFLPSLSLSSVDLQRRSFRFKVPLIEGKPIIDLYDQDMDNVVLDILKIGYNVKGIIYLKAIERDGNYIRIVWDLKQLKIKIPEQIFDSCQLSEGISEVELDDEVFPWEIEN